jgi:hypothetical protein
MTTTKVRWARIEYQLDLRSAQPRVPLGVLVLGGNAESARVLVAGRAPRPGSAPPDELRSVGPLGRSQLDGWVATMAKDVLTSFEKHEDPLDTLSSTWCWNLSVTAAEDADARPGETLREVAARLAPPAVMAPRGRWSYAEATYSAT